MKGNKHAMSCNKVLAYLDCKCISHKFHEADSLTERAILYKYLIITPRVAYSEKVDYMCTTIDIWCIWIYSEPFHQWYLTSSIDIVPGSVMVAAGLNGE